MFDWDSLSIQIGYTNFNSIQWISIQIGYMSANHVRNHATEMFCMLEQLTDPKQL